MAATLVKVRLGKVWLGTKQTLKLKATEWIEHDATDNAGEVENIAVGTRRIWIVGSVARTIYFLVWWW
jgi:hypothetical protein